MIYPDDFDDLPLPGEPGHDELPARVKLAYRIYELEAQVNNGGFHQFFGNSTGAHAPSAVEALQTIGATRTSEILRAAISIAYPSGFPIDPYLHGVELLDDDETCGRLSLLDDKFYRYEDDLAGLVNAYLNGQS